MASQSKWFSLGAVVTFVKRLAVNHCVRRKCLDRWFISLNQPNHFLQCWLKVRTQKRSHSTTREISDE